MSWYPLSTYLPQTSGTPAGPPLIASGVSDPGSGMRTDGAGNVIYVTNGAGVNCPLLMTTGGALADGQVAIRVANQPHDFYAALRSNYSGSSNTCYLAGLDNGGVFNFYRLVANSPTVITLATSTGPGTLTASPSVQYDLVANVVGSNLSVSLYSVTSPSSSLASGTLLGSATATDSAITGTGYSGFVALQVQFQVSQMANYTDVASSGATSYTATLASGGNGVVGSADTITITPNGTTTAVVTPHVSGVTGTFSPSTVTLSGTTPVTLTFTPTATGSGTISFTNSGSLTNPSSLADTVTGGAATTYTATLASGGAETTGSPDMISFAGNGTTTATITPHVAGVTGTFSPTTVALSGSTPVILSFTPTSGGTANLSFTNSGSLANPSNKTATVSSLITLTPGGTACLRSPFNWVNPAGGRTITTAASTWNVGAWAAYSWTTTSTSPTATLMIADPYDGAAQFMYSLNGAAPSAAYIPTGSAGVSIPGVATGSNSLYYLFQSSTQSGRWSGTNRLTDLGLVVDGSSTPVAAPSLRPWAKFVGDSLMEGIGVGAYLDWAHLVGANTLDALGYDFGVSACGASGWILQGDSSGDVPAYYAVNSGSYTASASRWNKLDSINSSLDTNGHSSAYGGTGQEPAIVIIDYGTNEMFRQSSTSDLTLSVTGTLTAERAAAPLAFIVGKIPTGTYSGLPDLGPTSPSQCAPYAAAIRAGVANYKAANPSDAKVFLFDLGAEISNRIMATTAGQTHFNSSGHSLQAAAFAGLLGKILAPAGSSGTGTYTAAANVRYGTDRGDGVLGTCQIPTYAQVLSNIPVDAGVGTVVLPTAGQVATGVVFGPGSIIVGTFAGPGGVTATGYSVIGLPTSPTVGITYPITVLLNGPASGAFTATFGALAGITWGGPVAIAAGGQVASTTATFALAGAYTPTIAHTGAGITSDPTLPTCTATAAAATAASSYQVLGMPAMPVVGEVYTVALVLNGPASTSFIATFGAQSGITWGGPVAIAAGANHGTTTVGFTAPGAYTPTIAHTGAGITSDPTLPTCTATAAAAGSGGLSPVDSANLAAIKAVTDSIAKQQIPGYVAGNVSTLAFSGNGSLSPVDNFYTGAVLTFLSSPVAGLGGLSLRIAGYVGAIRGFQFDPVSPWPVAPYAGDTFTIQGRID